MTVRKVVAGTAPCPRCGSATRTDGAWSWCIRCSWSDPEDDDA